MIRSLVLSLALLVASASASALPAVYVVDLSGPAESPPNASPGTGHAQITLDTDAHTMRLQLSFSGLLGTTTASHLHCCTPVAGTGTAGVATSTPTFPGFPLGVTSGTYDQTFNMTLASSYNPAFITAHGGTTGSAFDALVSGIQSGQAYLNVHSTVFPGGEIRGFIVAVPSPETAIGQLRDHVLSPTTTIDPGGIRNALRAKLDAALQALASNDVAEACESMQAFINLVKAQRNKHIRVPQQADEMLTQATAIQSLLGCL